MKKTIIACLATVFAYTIYAQSGTNSPYSQYGFGILSEQSTGFNRGMNGLGYGFHDHNQVNTLNPASYSSIDSLTFIFDAGVSGQITNFKEGNKKLNAKNANFEYVVASLRLAKHLGMSFGLIPYSNIGYSYSTKDYVGEMKSALSTVTYKGSGGLRQVYLGLGWQPFKGFAVGFNGGYLWGNYNRSLVNTYSETSANTLGKYYTADVRSYQLTAGLQYTAKFSKKDAVTLGLVYNLGHKIGGEPTCKVVSNNTQTAVSDTTVYPKGDVLELELPNTYGAGIMFNHNNKLKIGVDYTLQQWSKVSFPEYSTTSGIADYELKKGLFKDRHKVTVGGEYCPQEMGHRFLNRIHYRAGVSYATPYLKINGVDGPKEISASLGLSIPIMNSWNSRSLLNISAQWVRQDSKQFITENSFRINIGLTFNERWFMKWKVE